MEQVSEESPIKKTALVAIHEIRPIAKFTRFTADTTNAQTLPTHYVWFKTAKDAHELWNGVDKHYDALTDPTTKPAVVFQFCRFGKKVQKLFKRRASSKAIIYGQSLYYILTWHDATGEKNPGGRDLRYHKNKTMIYILHKAKKKYYNLAMSEIDLKL